MANQEYIPFGPEWEKEIQKLPKPILAAMLGRFGKEKNILLKIFGESKLALTEILNNETKDEQAVDFPKLRAAQALKYFEHLLTPIDEACR